MIIIKIFIIVFDKCMFFYQIGVVSVISVLVDGKLYYNIIDIQKYTNNSKLHVPRFCTHRVKHDYLR